MRRFVATIGKTKNLFDGKFANGVWTTTVGQEISFTPAVNRVGCLNPTKVKPNSTYTISANMSDSSVFQYRIIQTDANNIVKYSTSLTAESVTITTLETTEYIYFYIAQNISTTEGLKVQIEENSIATEYTEPYIKQNHIIKSVRPSRNLFDISDVTGSGYSNSSVELRNALRSLEIGKTYTLSCDYQLRFSGQAIQFRYRLADNTSYVTTSMSGNAKGYRSYWTFTMNEGIKTNTLAIIYFGIGGTQYADIGYAKNIQLEEGDRATPYEPYGLIEETHLVGDYNG